MINAMYIALIIVQVLFIIVIGGMLIKMLIDHVSHQLWLRQIKKEVEAERQERLRKERG